MPVAHQAAEVQFVVKDNDVVGSQLIGAVSIPVQELVLGTRIDGSFPILNASGKPVKDGAALTLSIQYTPMVKVPLYLNGIGAESDYNGVPGTYFPVRKGGRVTLYQDAHVHENALPGMELDGGTQFKQQSCWEDIVYAISQARRLIYIAGWSVNHDVKIIRDEGKQAGSTLGDLLKIKSQEGVRVLLLVWDDPTSRSIMGYKTVSIAELVH